ncbi:hypothetical protein C8R44DRAFT_881766 [Mycena epipterygia]|nr:hypothetical protein C8R44DRAFT_881766 [Mycena epipterygia]
MPAEPVLHYDLQKGECYSHPALMYNNHYLPMLFSNLDDAAGIEYNTTFDEIPALQTYHESHLAVHTHYSRDCAVCFPARIWAKL